LGQNFETVTASTPADAREAALKRRKPTDAVEHLQITLPHDGQ